MAYSDDFSGYNLNQKAIDNVSKEIALRIYKKIYYVREFEKRLARAVEIKKVTYPVYLSLGQEAVAAALSEILEGYLVFAQHRAHDLYLCLGGSPAKLRDELMGRTTGSSGGKAGSNCLQIHEKGIEMFGHHGLIGENVPQAVGAALGSGKPTICLFGDGAGEEDYIYPSLGFAVTKQLPIIFVCIDNNLSILTPKSVRRSWEIINVAEGLGMQCIDITDCPFTIMEEINHMDKSKPIFINCRVCRERWHVGIGIDGERAWERNVIVRNQLIQKGYKKEIDEIEGDVIRMVEEVWKDELG